MAYLNKVMLIGNLGKDPKIKQTQGGRKFANFSLATSKRYRDNNGEQKELTEWHNIVVWGRLAEVIEQLSIRKGMSLYVEGELTTRSWTDQSNGQKCYTIEINASTFQLLTPRQQQQQNNGYAQGNGYQQGYNQQQQGYNESDDDLPF